MAWDQANDGPFYGVDRPIVAQQQDGGVVAELLAIDEAAMYETPATTRAIIERAATALAEKDARIAALEAELEASRFAERNGKSLAEDTTPANPARVTDALFDKYPHQDEIERIILRRVRESRVDGFTLEMAHEIAAIGAGGQAVAVKDWDIETTADKIARQLAAEVKSFGPTGRIHGETYNAAKAGAIAAFKCAVATLSAIAHPVQPGWRDKIAEIRRQLAINVEIAKRDHPEGPVVDGKRIQGMLHSQEILAGHITDRLNELEAILAAPQPKGE